MILADQECKPSKANQPPLNKAQSRELLNQLDPRWKINSAGHLLRDYEFSNFADAMRFANAVAQIAEKYNHHPDLTIRWGHCQIEMWTHNISGLSKSDFVFAAKSELAYQARG